MNDITALARQLRLAVVTNVFEQGLLSEEEARELLTRPLSPGDDSTIYDDSALLSDPDGLEKIASSVPKPVADGRGNGGNSKQGGNLMAGHYILDGKEPVEVPDLITWVTQFETADRIVKQTSLGKDIMVSTVFLGLDHQFGEGSPLLFETMVFGGEHDQDQWRYSTWDEAEAGHKAVVANLTT